MNNMRRQPKRIYNDDDDDDGGGGDEFDFDVLVQTTSVRLQQPGVYDGGNRMLSLVKRMSMNRSLYREVKPCKRFRVTSETLNNLITTDEYDDSGGVASTGKVDDGAIATARKVETNSVATTGNFDGGVATTSRFDSAEGDKWSESGGESGEPSQGDLNVNRKVYIANNPMLKQDLNLDTHKVSNNNSPISESLTSKTLRVENYDRDQDSSNWDTTGSKSSINVKVNRADNHTLPLNDTNIHQDIQSIATNGSDFDREHQFLKLFNTMLNSKPGKRRQSRVQTRTFDSYFKVSEEYVKYCAKKNFESFDVDGKLALEFLAKYYIPKLAKQKGVDVKTHQVRYSITGLRFLNNIIVDYNHFIGNLNYPETFPNSDLLRKLHNANRIPTSLLDELSIDEVLVVQTANNHDVSLDRVAIREKRLEESETRFYDVILTLYENTHTEPLKNLKFLLDLALSGSFSLSNSLIKEVTLADIYLRKQSLGGITESLLFISTWKGTDYVSATYLEVGTLRHKSVLSCPFTIIGLWFYFHYNDYNKKPNFESDTQLCKTHLLFSKERYNEETDTNEDALLKYLCSLTKYLLDEVNQIVNFRPFLRYENVQIDGRPNSTVLARDSVIPPLALQKQVFPWLDEELDTISFVRSKSQGKSQYRTALEFLNLLKHLRVTILQDMVVLNDKVPENHFTKDPITQSSLYAKFREQLFSSMNSKARDCKVGETKNIEGMAAIQNQSLDYLVDSIVKRTQEMQQPATKEDLAKVSDSIKSLSNVIDTLTTSVNSSKIELKLKNNAKKLKNNAKKVKATPLTSSGPPGSQKRLPKADYSLSQVHDKDKLWNMNRKILDIPGAVHEWYYSKPHNVVKMNEKYGSTWRRLRKDAKYYRLRSFLMQFVDEQAKSTGLSLSHMAELLEDYRQDNSLSLRGISLLVQEKGSELQNLVKLVKNRADSEIGY
jgi:hypothetical protein